MARTHCPQVAGIYESNKDFDEDEKSYEYVLVPNTNPDAEWWAIDCFPCERDGTLLDSWKQSGVVFLATDFGSCVSVIKPWSVNV